MNIYYPESPKNRWYKQSFSVHKLPFAASVSIAGQTAKEKDAAFEALQASRKGKSIFQQLMDERSASREAKQAAKEAAEKAAAAPPHKDASGKIYKPPQPLELPEIVKPLDAHSFRLCSKLYSRWFDGQAYSVEPGGTFRNSNVDAATVTHEYLLGFERYKRAFEYVRSRDFLNRTDVREALAQHFAGLPDGSIYAERDFNTDVQAAHKAHAFASVRVGHNFPNDYGDVRLEGVGKSDLWVDDLELALGEFRLYVAVDEARIVRNRQTRFITLKSIYVYGVSTFAPGDTGSDAYMGHWSKKHLALVPDGRNGWAKEPVYKGEDPSDGSSIYWPITRPDFANWRKQHGQGGDLMIFTERRRPRIEDIELPPVVEEEEADDSDAFSMVLTPLQLSAMLEGGTIEPEGSGPSTVVRLLGAVQMIGGALEMVGGTGLLLVPEPTMITKIGGVALNAYGADNLTTGWKQVRSGQDQVSYTAHTAEHTASTFGASPQQAMLIGMTVDLGVGLGSGGIAGLSKVKSIRKGIADLEYVEDVKHGGKVVDGGHTIDKHVGKDHAYLLNRLATERRIPAATSFRNLEEASKFTSRAMAANRTAIKQWAATAPNGRISNVFTFEVGQSVGYGFPRATGAYSEAFTKVGFRLKKLKANNKEFIVLTAFPLP